MISNIWRKTLRKLKRLGRHKLADIIFSTIATLIILKYLYGGN